ncbi:hypothetical protein VP01_3779g4 [Puccinia sorghi]|uniref:Uncharacterized protein n=1 Tax=Puccinia sorghi TaxID=27349 RepID=A0A0L6UUH2_9BASI|nr:hypothetical protein VP01_3779g4 [Puccinia sorghi]
MGLNGGTRQPGVSCCHWSDDWKMWLQRALKKKLARLSSMLWHSHCAGCTVTVNQSLVESLFLDWGSSWWEKLTQSVHQRSQTNGSGLHGCFGDNPSVLPSPESPMCGHVPLWEDNPDYISQKKKRENNRHCGLKDFNSMQLCQFSNYDPKAVQKVIEGWKESKLKHKLPKKATENEKCKFTAEEEPQIIDFLSQLMSDIKQFYKAGIGRTILISDRVNLDDCKAVLEQLGNITDIELLCKIVKCFPGQLVWLLSLFGQL